MRHLVAFLLVLASLAWVTGCSRPAPPPAPVAAPPPVSAKEPAPPVETVQRSKVTASATGDLGSGSVLVEVLALESEEIPLGLAEGILTLQVKEAASGRVLASLPMQGNEARQVDIVDFAPNQAPYIVVHGRHNAVSDHSAFARVFRLEGAGLRQFAEMRGWYGSTGTAEESGRPVIKVSSRWYAFNEYIHTDLSTKPAPKLLRLQTFGYQDGQFIQLADEFSRLAYGLYDRREMEKPLPPAAVEARQRGEQLLGEGKAAEAAVQLEAALALAPDYPDALSDLSLAYARLGRWDDSSSAARKAVELNPWHAHAQFNLGFALLEQGLAKEAEAPLRMATGLQMDRWEPHYYLGLAYERMGDKAQALTEYELALKIQPESKLLQDARARFR